MFKFKKIILMSLCSVLIMGISGAAHANDFAETTGKKLIEYGWDVPTPEYARDHIREMEKRPFEGVIFRLPNGGGKVFDVDNWQKNSSILQDQLGIAASIKWNKFTDNFVGMYAASTMDWYSDSDWKKVLSAVRFNAQIAKASNSVGLLFDPEPYGTNPWHYADQKHADKYSFEQYSKQVYLRGQQFMRTAQRQVPNIKILMFHQYNMLYGSVHSWDDAKRQKSISNHNYGLYLPFLNGMLSVIADDAQMIDGNENSYYYEKPEQFYKAYWQMRHAAKINVPAGLHQKYDTNEKAAQALYVDHLFAKRAKRFISSYMTEQERAQWFEQNTYHALTATDEYAWLYSEKMNWWKDTDLPAGLENAIISAKNKLKNEEDLGYDMAPIFQNARDKFDAAVRSELKEQNISIKSLEGKSAPKIDGKLDDEIYSVAEWLDAFYSRYNTAAPVAATRAFVTYDKDNLYIAFRAEEPNMEQQKITGDERDSNVWLGESVEVSILQDGQKTDNPDAIFYHFILNPANVQWDGINTGTRANTDYNPLWRSATSKNGNGWIAEIAISWKSVGMKNVIPGTEIRINFARQRVSDKTELSSWSQFLTGFQEPQYFGTIRLK